MSLYCLQSHILTKPENSGFVIDSTVVESFLKDLLQEAFPANIGYIRVTEEPDESAGIEERVDLAAKKLATGEAHALYGMKFLLSQAKSIGMKREFIEEVFKALAKIHYQEPKELKPEPNEDDPNYEDVRDAVYAENEDIEKANE